MNTLPILTRVKILLAAKAITAWQCDDITARTMFVRLVKAIGTVPANAVRGLLSKNQSSTEIEGLIRRALALPRHQWEPDRKDGG